jgi:hypothetical protein
MARSVVVVGRSTRQRRDGCTGEKVAWSFGSATKIWIWQCAMSLDGDPRFARHDPVTEPVLWVSDQPVAEAGPMWARLRAQHPQTGLWPLLLEGLSEWEPQRPWHVGELAPVDLPPVGERDANQVLSRLWEQATSTGAGGFDWGDAAPLPFDSWPGLASAGAGGGDAGALADAVAAKVGGERAVFAGPVPALSGGEALAVSGWLGAANHAATEDIAIVIGSWEQRFGLDWSRQGSTPLIWPSRLRLRASARRAGWLPSILRSAQTTWAASNCWMSTPPHLSVNGIGVSGGTRRDSVRGRRGCPRTGLSKIPRRTG